MISCSVRRLLLAMFLWTPCAHIRLEDKQRWQWMRTISKDELLFVICNCKKLSCTKMSKPVYLIKYQVTTTKCVYPLDFPARISKVQPFVGALNINALLRLSFQSFTVTIIYRCHRESFIIFHINSFLICQFRPIFTSWRPHNLLICQHPSDLSSKEIRHGR